MADTHTNITLHVEGMDCTSCALGITKNLEKNGAENVYVDFASGEANFLLHEKSKLPKMIDGITQLGYKVVDSKYREENEGKMSDVEKRFYFTLPFSLVLFVSHMVLSHDAFINKPLVQLLICVPVFVIGVMQFGKSAWGSLKLGVPNMDVLIFIGSTAAFIYSLIGMWLYWGTHEIHNYLFFETTATIITLVLLGNVFEARSVKQTTTALKELNEIQVTKAKLLSLQMGKEVITEVDIKEVIVGSIVYVNNGDKIPLDGEIIEGQVSIDESMLTGESIPVEKTIGEKVFGGTIVVSGSVKMRIEAVARDTVLSKIIEMVKKAQQNKPEIQKLGDKISAIFVPVVLGIAVITFVVNYFFVDFSADVNVLQESMMRAIAVLVISCPCAMGLATPTAVMVGIGRAAKMGILIKGGSTLEEFAKVKNIIFDKTGTLTTGAFKLKAITTLGGESEEEIKSILLGLEKHSSHPIAKSIVNELQNELSPQTYTEVKEEKGLGISALDSNNNKVQLVSYNGVQYLTNETNHNIYVLKNEKLIATVDLADDLKKNAKKVIEEFNRKGVNTVMLSGDTKLKCEEVAQKVNIREVYAEQLPDQKLALVEKLTTENYTAMVGDGINDAPSLAKATVGISLSDATQVAIQSAQIVLLKSNDLSILTKAYLISKHSLITIKQNLFWAFFYNVVAIPVAAAGFLSPTVGALAMAFSDVVVIGNSIRLKVKKLS